MLDKISFHKHFKHEQECLLDIKREASPSQLAVVAKKDVSTCVKDWQKPLWISIAKTQMMF